MDDSLHYRILLIDDEARFLFGLKGILEREGCTVYTAVSSIEGMELVKTVLPDIILCDVMMLAPNGFLLKKFLMDDERTANIPFFFVSARSDQEDVIMGLQIGADDYITKPIHIEELLARIKAVMRRRRV